MRTELVKSTTEWQVSQSESSSAAGRVFLSPFDESVDVMTIPGCKAQPVPPPRHSDSG